MADYTPTGDAGQGKGGQPNIGAEIVDVLLRGLATTKARLESGDPELRAGQVCIGWYVDHDHSCAIWYSNPQ